MPLSKGQEERAKLLSNLRITQVSLAPSQDNFNKILIHFNDWTHTSIKLEKTSFTGLVGASWQDLLWYQILDDGKAVHWSALDVTIPLEALL